VPAVLTRIVAAALISAALTAPNADARVAAVTITFTATPPEAATSPDATFDFTTSVPATFRCYLDGTETPKPCEPPLTYKTLPNARHSFSVVATATDGSGQGKAAYSWTVSVPPPETRITSGPVGTVDTNTARFAFTANQTGATFSCTLDGGTATSCVTGVSYRGLALGQHTFTVAATTGYGTDSTPDTAIWNVAPNTSITSGPATRTRSRSATFTFSSTGDGATFECSVDGKAFAACTSPLRLTGLEPGKHRLAVRAVLSGVVDETPAAATWRITPSIAPETSFTRQPRSSTHERDATFAFVARPAAATFECSLDGAPFAACASPLTLHRLRRGDHTLRVRARSGDLVEATPAVASWRIVAAASFPWLPIGGSGAAGLVLIVGGLAWAIRALRRRRWQRSSHAEQRPETCIVPQEYVWRHDCKPKPALSSVEQLIVSRSDNGGRAEQELEGVIVDRLNRAARVARIVGTRHVRRTVTGAAVELAAALDRWVEQPAAVEISARLTGSKAECEFTRYECEAHAGECTWKDRGSWKAEVEVGSTQPVADVVWPPAADRLGELEPALLALVASVAGRRVAALEAPPAHKA
jgi:hypothetical protein